ncbi:MAG: hypothetical protein AB7T14_06965 [Candidatus Methylacidiphilaceae bacterium]
MASTLLAKPIGRRVSRPVVPERRACWQSRQEVRGPEKYNACPSGEPQDEFCEAGLSLLASDIPTPECTWEEPLPEEFLPTDAEERQEVLEFLSENPDLKEPLLEAQKQLPNYFGHSVLRRAVLRVVENPEEPEDRMLVFFVTARSSIPEGLERLEKFCREWWFQDPAFAEGKLEIDVKFSGI